jgi:site-specific DNA recombinase
VRKGDRALVYNRVSTSDQADHGTSLTTQSEANHKLAEAERLRVVAEFREDYTGTKSHRPEWNKVVAMARKGEFDVLICYDPDRLARGLYAWANTYGVVHMELGIEVLFVINGGDEFVLNIRAVVGGEELKKIRERTERGKQQKSQQGLVLAGGAPYGYRYIKGENRFEIDEREATWVRQMYDWYTSERISLVEVVRRLCQLGAPTRGGQAHWYIEQVRNIFRSETYCGVWYWNKRKCIEPTNPRKDDEFAKEQKTSHVKHKEEEWVRVESEAVPAIVDRVTWRAAQSRMDDNKARAKRNTKRYYLLRGRVYCELCGSKMSGISRKEGTDKQGNNIIKLTYECIGKSAVKVAGGAKRCTARNIHATKLEEFVWGEVERILTDPRALLDLSKGSEEEDRAKEQDEAALRSLVEEAAALDRQEERLLELYETGGTTRLMYDRRRTAIEEERQRTQAARDEVERRLEEREVKIASAEAIKELSEAAQDRLPTLTYEEKQEIIGAMKLMVIGGGKNISIGGLVSDAVLPFLSRNYEDSVAPHIQPQNESLPSAPRRPLYPDQARTWL